VSRFRAGETELLANLDDFPNFAEVFEDLRGSDLVGTCDRIDFVEECLLRAIHSDPADAISVRRLGVLSTYLRAICREADRCSPSRAQIVTAIMGSLTRPSGERVLQQLHQFKSALDVRVETSDDGTLGLISRRQPGPIDQIRLVRRDCSPNGRNRVALDIQTPITPPGRSDERNRDWQPDDFHYERLEPIRRKVLRHAVLGGTATTSQEFRGSLEQGIDLRRSIRSAVKDDRIFVRQKARGLRTGHILGAPIVWILRESERGGFNTRPFGAEALAKLLPTHAIDEDDEFVRCQHVSAGHRITRKYKDPSLTIAYHYVVGRVTYGPFIGDPLLGLLRGARLEAKFPNHRRMVHPWGVGCLDPSFEPVAHQHRWDELLLLSAAKHADRCLILVAPADYEPAEPVRQMFVRSRITLLRVNLELLNPLETFWLSRAPVAEGKTKECSQERFAKEIWPALEAEWRV